MAHNLGVDLYSTNEPVHTSPPRPPKALCTSNVMNRIIFKRLPLKSVENSRYIFIPQ